MELERVHGWLAEAAPKDRAGHTQRINVFNTILKCQRDIARSVSWQCPFIARAAHENVLHKSRTTWPPYSDPAIWFWGGFNSTLMEILLALYQHQWIVYWENVLEWTTLGQFVDQHSTQHYKTVIFAISVHVVKRIFTGIQPFVYKLHGGIY